MATLVGKVSYNVSQQNQHLLYLNSLCHSRIVLFLKIMEERLIK